MRADAGDGFVGNVDNAGIIHTLTVSQVDPLKML